MSRLLLAPPETFYENWMIFCSVVGPSDYKVGPDQNYLESLNFLSLKKFMARKLKAKIRVKSVVKHDSEQTKKTLSVWYFAAPLNFSLRNSKPGLWPCHSLCYFPLATYRKCQTDKSQNPEQRVPCLSTDLEIWWPWTFEDDADFDALFCFMQTSKFECVIAWIFSSRQGRTAPSKKELVK